MKFFTTLTALLFASALSLSAQTLHVDKHATEGDATRTMVPNVAAHLTAPAGIITRAAKHPIDEQPEGILKTYEMSTEYYSQNMDEWVHRYGQKTMVVFGEDNTVYVQNIINTNLYNTWIVGEISADRKHVVFDNYQPYVEMNDYTYYVSLAYVNENDDVFPDTETD